MGDKNQEAAMIIHLSRKPLDKNAVGYQKPKLHDHSKFGRPYGQRRNFNGNRNHGKENYNGNGRSPNKRFFDRRPFDGKRREGQPNPRYNDRNSARSRSKDDGYVPRDRSRFGGPRDGDRRERGRSHGAGYGPREDHRPPFRGFRNDKNSDHQGDRRPFGSRNHEGNNDRPFKQRPFNNENPHRESRPFISGREFGRGRGIGMRGGGMRRPLGDRLNRPPFENRRGGMPRAGAFPRDPADE